jgi:hypothetical protein
MEVLIQEVSIVSAVLNYFVTGNALTAQGTALVGATADIVNNTITLLALLSTNILGT